MARKRKARAIASKIHNLANEKRRERGLKTLDGHRPLNRAAERYARVVMDAGKLSHYADGRDTIADRYKGYDTWGENLVKRRDVDRSETALAKDAVSAWMNSPGHRENMLRPNGRLDGVGVWIRGDTMIAAHVIAAGRTDGSEYQTGPVEQPDSLLDSFLP